MADDYLDDLLAIDAPACKNCKYYYDISVLTPAPAAYVFGGPKCCHPTRKVNDPVYGRVMKWRNCREARRDTKDCGVPGRLYAASLRTRIVRALFGREA